jgi:hypothetical protein
MSTVILISRQRRYQLKNEKAGKCRQCGKKPIKADTQLCKKCWGKQKVANRAAYIARCKAKKAAKAAA